MLLTELVRLRILECLWRCLCPTGSTTSSSFHTFFHMLQIVLHLQLSGAASRVAQGPLAGSHFQQEECQTGGCHLSDVRPVREMAAAWVHLTGMQGKRALCLRVPRLVPHLGNKGMAVCSRGQANKLGRQGRWVAGGGCCCGIDATQNLLLLCDATAQLRAGGSCT
jgi:hypothetical protein